MIINLIISRIAFLRYEGVENINYTKIGIKQMRIYKLSRDVVDMREFPWTSVRDYGV